ncbi:NUDIX domain-containing protein [Candidatus Woesearchaeota archaeon]|nr:NUDIX domain-containing protein [Candidatus Woesearchaeota archaeon]
MKQASLLILENGDGEVLFAKRVSSRENLPGVWSLPSETIEEGESKENAARRCIVEELDNISVESLSLFDAQYFNIGGKEKVLYLFKGLFTGNPTINETRELELLEFLNFPDFFAKYSDDQMGHALQYLRHKWS